MQVKDAMNPKVISASKDISIKEAARTLTKHEIGSLIIVEDEKIVGVITESDIIRKVVATGLDPSVTLVEEMMTKDVITIDADAELNDACQTMVDHKIKRLPVLDGGQLVGIITTTDIISVEPKLMEELGKIMLFSERQ
ncbi:MAG: CBS domain-containing protein, partial [Candidatus Aenigmarchaeota archaeon]|nr:CBS domain-containing protein [Candidatus Aenigmarchaeota archaeon]